MSSGAIISSPSRTRPSCLPGDVTKKNPTSHKALGLTRSFSELRCYVLQPQTGNRDSELPEHLRRLQRNLSGHHKHYGGGPCVPSTCSYAHPRKGWDHHPLIPAQSWSTRELPGNTPGPETLQGRKRQALASWNLRSDSGRDNEPRNQRYPMLDGTRVWKEVRQGTGADDELGKVLPSETWISQHRDLLMGSL